MYELREFLFPSSMDESSISVFLLCARIIFGGLLMFHGMQKCMNFKSLSATFPDPFHIGNKNSLLLAIFGELICSFCFVLGFLYRLVMLPMMFTMVVAGFIVLRKAPYSDKELSIIYLIVFVLMYIAGPGKYAIDYFFSIH